MLENACSQYQNRVCPTLPRSGISWNSRAHQSMELSYELIFNTTTLIPCSPRAHLTIVGASTSPSSPQAVRAPGRVSEVGLGYVCVCVCMCALSSCLLKYIQMLWWYSVMRSSLKLTLVIELTEHSLQLG